MGDFDFTNEPPARRIVPAAQPRTTNSVALTSLVIGCLCVPLAFIPLLGLATFPLAGLGLLLGLFGLAVATAREGAGIGFAFGGIATNATALWVAYIWASAIAEAAKELPR